MTSSSCINDYILAAICTASLISYKFDILYILIPLILAVLHALLNIYNYYRPLQTGYVKDGIEWFYNYYCILYPTIAWPYLICLLWVKEGFPLEKQVLNMFIAIFMFGMVVEHCAKEDMVDLLVAINSVSLTAVAIITYSMAPIYESLLFVAAHFLTFYLKLQNSNELAVESVEDDVHHYCVVALGYLFVSWSNISSKGVGNPATQVGLTPINAAIFAPIQQNVVVLIE